MFKAMALICAVLIADGRAKQECFYHMFAWKAKTKKECQLRLIQYQIHKMPSYHKLILSECILVEKS